MRMPKTVEQGKNTNRKQSNKMAPLKNLNFRFIHFFMLDYQSNELLSIYRILG